MMRIGLLAALLGSFVAALTVPTGAVFAQTAELSCGAFELVGVNKTTNIVDNPPEGDSPGDIRVGLRELADRDGNPAGALYFVSTLVRLSDAGEHLFVADFQIDLPDGLLIGSTNFQRVNDTTQESVPLVVVITGGSDAYRGATGILEIESGETPQYSFDLDCA